MPPQDTTPVTDLERRKHVRLLVRRDLAISAQKYEGRTYYVVKDPISLRYYRFKEEEHFLIKMMDGNHTLDDAQISFEKRFRPERLTLEDLEQFGQQLLTAGLVQNESPQAGKQLFDRRKKRRRSEMMQMFTNILYIKIPIFDPEKLLTKMLPYLGWMFTLWFLAASLAFMGGAISLVLTHFETFLERLPSYHEFFSLKTVFELWAALGIVKVIHEFGHGLSCKAFGGEVHEMGFLLLCFSPAMYCNVSDAWTLPSKWKRIIISGAGIYVELMIASAATFIWWNSPSYPFLNHMSLSLMIVCSVSTVMFNGNPLMRYDGYYVLADWIEIPNLRDRSNRYIQKLAMENCLGIEGQPEPYMELTRRILFLTYASISWVYRWVVTFFILRFTANFLKPYKLEVVSKLLTMVAIGSMVGWPLYRLLSNIHKRGRLPDMKSTRVTMSSVAVALLLGAFLFVPLPVSRIRGPGLVEFKDATQVYVEIPATLKAVYVKESDPVRKGKVLAVFYSEELENRREEIKAQIETKKGLGLLYQEQLSKSRDPRGIDQLKREYASVKNEQTAAQKQLTEVETDMKRLVLRAPRDGIVVGLPQIDEIGKKWEKEQTQPFCSLGDPTKMQVLVPIVSVDYDILRENVAKRHGPQQVPVTIRVQGRAAHQWRGKIAEMPVSEAKEIPPALSSKGGGPIAVQPDRSQKKLAPQSQMFLVKVDIEYPDAAICAGTLAQVKIHNEYRSCAWWLWRTLSSTLDLGLM